MSETLDFSVWRRGVGCLALTKEWLRIPSMRSWLVMKDLCSSLTFVDFILNCNNLKRTNYKRSTVERVSEFCFDYSEVRL